MARHTLGDVVVLLPGILGSVIERDGKEIWAPSPGGVLRSLWTLAGSVCDLELHGDPQGDPGTGWSTRLMPDVHIIPGLWGVDGYSAISAMITSTFNVVPGKTFIEFAYDWRLSNKVSAERLAAVALAALHEQRKVNPDAKIVLIGHSMGGLVSRYFLECLGGVNDTRMLITFGTPYRGSLNALGFLANGVTKKVGPFKVLDLSTLVRSLPSAYQLLPIYPCVSAGTGALTRVSETDGLPPGVDRTRAHRTEHEFHRVIEAAVAARGPESPYLTHPVVGLTQPTLQSARLSGRTLEMLSSFDGDDLDGTVPRVSAVPIEYDGRLPDPAVYASERHASLQNALSVQTQLLGLLSPVERPDRFKDARGGLRPVIDDLYEVGEEIGVTVVAGIRRATLVATVSDVDTGRPVAGPLLLQLVDDQLTHTVELSPVPEGCYRLTIAAVGEDAAAVHPVHGLFLVAGGEEQTTEGLPMAKAVYALLVGINDYEGRVNQLGGCVEDVLGFEAFLKGHVPIERRRVLRLLDRRATRQSIIDGFTGHLSRADLGDVAIFYFSGHGSTESVEQRYWHLEPSGRNQTIVCFDSRKPGIPDLADKEINELIGGVAARGPHVLAILDCCHAGGATRDVDVRIRSAPEITTPRPFEQYLTGMQQAWKAATRNAGTLPVELGEPPRHVALSACESGQLSKELRIGDRYRGVFSAMLQQALTTLGPGATYRDLLGAASSGVRDKVLEQEPVGYAMPVDALDQPLFGGVVQLRQHAVTLEHYHDQWWIDAGALHGIQPPVGGDTTVLAVLPPQDKAHHDAYDEDEAQDEGVPAAARKSLGQVRVIEVELTRCRVAASGWQPDPGTRYPTVVVDIPIPPATVEMHGDTVGVALIRAALAGSPHIREGAAAPGINGDRFVVLAESGQLVVARADGTPMAPPVETSQDGAITVVRRLEHLARWHLIKRLDNPGSSIANTVTIEIVPAEHGEQTPPARGTRAPVVPASDGRIHLHYQQTGTAWQHPYVWIYLHNGSPRDLYCTLLDLTDRYRCHSRLFPGTRLPAGATTVAFDGRPVDVSLPKERIGTPGSEVYDWLKLIASEQRFAPNGYELPNLDGIFPTRSATRGHESRTVLDRLADRVVTRDAGDEAAAAPEWTTTLLTLRTHGPA